MDISTALLYLLTLLLASCLGSPLSYVANRLPKKLEKQWRSAAICGLPPGPSATGNEEAATNDVDAAPGGLPFDAKSEPLVNHQRYQTRLLGLASGLLTVTVFALYGASLQSLLIFGACLALLVLAVIDIRTYLLPDVITLPLLWMGFVYQMLIQPAVLSSAVVGAMTGYLMLWSLYWIFKLTTGRDAMGFGDFKLLAAICAWVGVGMLPLIMVVSAGAGIVVGVALKILVPGWKERTLPFGPFLAIAGWICILGGDALLSRYPSLMF